jgi:hypothetical protein
MSKSQDNTGLTDWVIRFLGDLNPSEKEVDLMIKYLGLNCKDKFTQLCKTRLERLIELREKFPEIFKNLFLSVDVDGLIKKLKDPQWKEVAVLVLPTKPDESGVFNLVYQNLQNNLPYVHRFIVDGYVSIDQIIDIIRSFVINQQKYLLGDGKVPQNVQMPKVSKKTSYPLTNDKEFLYDTIPYQYTKYKIENKDYDIPKFNNIQPTKQEISFISYLMKLIPNASGNDIIWLLRWIGTDCPFDYNNITSCQKRLNFIFDLIQYDPNSIKNLFLITKDIQKNLSNYYNQYLPFLTLSSRTPGVINYNYLDVNDQYKTLEKEIEEYKDFNDFKKNFPLVFCNKISGLKIKSFINNINKIKKQTNLNENYINELNSLIQAIRDDPKIECKENTNLLLKLKPLPTIQSKKTSNKNLIDLSSPASSGQTKGSGGAGAQENVPSVNIEDIKLTNLSNEEANILQNVSELLKKDPKFFDKVKSILQNYNPFD